MSGAGRKVFQPGEVLTASNVQNYLQDQAVQYYAGTAARGSAIGTATTEGMMSYLADTDKLQLATGTATWVDVYPAVPLTGNIIQVKQAYASTAYAQSTAGNTFTDYPNSELQVLITPRNASSKFLLLCSITVGTLNGNDAAFRFTRNGAGAGIGAPNGSRQQATGITGWLQNTDPNHQATTISGAYLDSPNTTSQITYNVQGAGESGTTLYNRTGAYANTSVIYNATFASTLTVLEVAG